MPEPDTTILVADDDPNARELLEVHLSNMGFSIVFAADGRTALNQARDLVPDIILLDAMMPRMTGFEVCREIRADKSLKQIPILMITALDDRESRLEGLNAGADEFITKPFDSRELRARLRLIAELNRFRGIQREKEKFQRVVDLAPDGVLILDASLEILFANRSANDLFAATVDLPLVGTRFPFLIQQMNVGQFDETLFNELQESGGNRHLGGMLQRLDQQTLPANISAGAFEWEGQPAIQVNISDLTRQHELESQLLRSQRLQGLGSIAGGIAHDLNNVITPILMGTEILAERLTDKDNRDVVSMIGTAGQRGSDLVKQVLTFARGSEQSMGTVRLHHVIKEVRKLMFESLPADVELKTIQNDPALAVTGDPTQLIQVLINLCVNARDAIGEEGKIEITVARSTGDTGKVMLRVSDDGSGMPPEVVEKLGQPFFTTKPEGKGTGLGIATVKTILKNHDAELKVSSTPGEGSRFEMLFDAANDEESDPVQPAIETDVQGHGELILVCDDELAIREMTASALSCFGYEVVQAGDGVEGMARYHEHVDRLHAVVTDLRMPYIDGLQLVESVREETPMVGCIMMTTESSPELRTQVENLGAHLLPKPFTTAQLTTVVAEALLRRHSGLASGG
ncbi:MAG: hypothetical protein CMO80_03610 [Verrucomicrobiales bacterium]|nr:hypothetical protein [Verrucomicrobiales bacterium]